MNKEYIFIGPEYKEEKFKEIKNTFRNKPSGGLWLSPVNSENSWQNFISKNTYLSNPYYKPQTFTIKEDSKILLIDSEEKYKLIPLQKNPNQFIEYLAFQMIDFESIAKEYDAIEYVYDSNRNFIKDIFYAWDVDSLLVFNKDILIKK